MRLLTDPFQAGFMQRALIEAVLLGVVGGVVGVHVVLRRLAFMADALTHTVFPGMAVAFLLSGSLYVGALVTGVASAVLLTLLTRNRRVTSDAAAALGYPIGTLDLVLNILITLVVVSAVKAVGSVLVIALLITPAATARLLVRRHVGLMMAVAAAVGAIGGWLGLVISYEGSLQHGWRLASGATIVLTLTAMFLVVLAASAVARRRHRPDEATDESTTDHPLLDPHEPLIDDAMAIGSRP